MSNDSCEHNPRLIREGLHRVGFGEDEANSLNRINPSSTLKLLQDIGAGSYKRSTEEWKNYPSHGSTQAHAPPGEQDSRYGKERTRVSPSPSRLNMPRSTQTRIAWNSSFQDQLHGEGQKGQPAAQEQSSLDTSGYWDVSLGRAAKPSSATIPTEQRARKARLRRKDELDGRSMPLQHYRYEQPVRRESNSHFFFVKEPEASASRPITRSVDGGREEVQRSPSRSMKLREFLCEQRKNRRLETSATQQVLRNLEAKYSDDPYRLHRALEAVALKGGQLSQARLKAGLRAVGLGVADQDIKTLWAAVGGNGTTVPVSSIVQSAMGLGYHGNRRVDGEVTKFDNQIFSKTLLKEGAVVRRFQNWIAHEGAAVEDKLIAADIEKNGRVHQDQLIPILREQGFISSSEDYGTLLNRLNCLSPDGTISYVQLLKHSLGNGFRKEDCKEEVRPLMVGPRRRRARSLTDHLARALKEDASSAQTSRFVKESPKSPLLEEAETCQKVIQKMIADKGVQLSDEDAKVLSEQLSLRKADIKSVKDILKLLRDICWKKSDINQNWELDKHVRNHQTWLSNGVDSCFKPVPTDYKNLSRARKHNTWVSEAVDSCIQMHPPKSHRSPSATRMQQTWVSDGVHGSFRPAPAGDSEQNKTPLRNHNTWLSDGVDLCVRHASRNFSDDCTSLLQGLLTSKGRPPMSTLQSSYTSPTKYSGPDIFSRTYDSSGVRFTL